MALWRPPVPARSRREPLRLAALFGLTLGVMNLSFYEALDRIPLGIAVTIEFAGPLGVAVIGSRRRGDLAWVALAAAGIVLLADPGGGDGIDALGLVFVLVAGGCWAVYIVLAPARRARLPRRRRRWRSRWSSPRSSRSGRASPRAAATCCSPSCSRIGAARSRC